MGEDTHTTEGVDTLLGDPKKAILNQSGPMIIAMLVNSLYSLVDSIWVAGLGDNALAAVGFITPVFLIGIGFAAGLGAGATSAISRFIGAGDKNRVDNAGMHTILLVLVATVILTFTIWLFLKPIMMFLGAGITIDMCMEYGNVVFAGMIFFIFSAAVFGILRGEGNVKKTTYAIILGATLNIIFDPIFIYVLGWGLAGAGFASILASAIGCIPLLYWLKGNTYIDLNFKKFKYDFKILKTILNVAIPSASEFLVIAILSGALNTILVTVSGPQGVAIYSAGWRVVMIAIVPLLSVGMAVVPIAGASFGARKFNKLIVGENYAIKLGILIAIITAIATYMLAPYIAVLFSYSGETIALGPKIADFLKIMCLFYLFVPIGVVSSSMFQGFGKGIHSLALAAIRELLLIVVVSYILAIIFGFGKEGVWWGIVIGNIIGSLIAYGWSKIYIKKLIELNS